ncbi:hypothetical protein FQU75_22160 [Paenibacillus polymyxa]|nr:hypothetical protein FQU75_22160 [Paenibacillus polymyxa]
MKNIRDLVYESSKGKLFLEHLDDRDDTFWESISYLKMLNDEKLDKEDDLFYHARFFITSRLINHIVATYQMLKMGLEDECLVMLRQTYETSWLLKYFIENPDKAKLWIKANNKFRISPQDRRIAVDNNTTSQRIYSQLSEIVHSNHNSFWGSCIGGMFNSYITDKLFAQLIILIKDVIEYFEQITNLFETSIDNEELIELREVTKQKLGISIYVTSYLLDPHGTAIKLIELSEDEVLRYLEEIIEFE